MKPGPEAKRAMAAKCMVWEPSTEGFMAVFLPTALTGALEGRSRPTSSSGMGATTDRAIPIAPVLMVGEVVAQSTTTSQSIWRTAIGGPYD
jgi:hypothetical protein